MLRFVHHEGLRVLSALGALEALDVSVFANASRDVVRSWLARTCRTTRSVAISYWDMETFLRTAPGETFPAVHALKDAAWSGRRRLTGSRALVDTFPALRALSVVVLDAEVCPLDLQLPHLRHLGIDSTAPGVLSHEHGVASLAVSVTDGDFISLSKGEYRSPLASSRVTALELQWGERSGFLGAAAAVLLFPGLEVLDFTTGVDSMDAVRPFPA